MPADTLVYGEFRTSDLMTTLNRFADIVRKTGAPVPENLFADLDAQLTKAFGRPTTVEKDILTWVGDHAAVGVRVDQKILDAVASGDMDQMKKMNEQPEFVLVLAIKDEAAADAFFKDAFAVTEKSGQKYTATQEKIGADTATIYANPSAPQTGQIARWKGYIAFSNTTNAMVLDTLKNNAPRLADDAAYKKTIGLLKPDNLFTVYLRSQLTPLLTLAMMGPSIGSTFDSIVANLNGTTAPTPTPTPMPTVSPERAELFKALLNLGSTAIGGRLEAKAMAIDVASVTNPEAIQTITRIMGLPADFQSQMILEPLSGKLADQIPQNALGAIMGSGIPKGYHALRSVLASMPKMMELMGNGAEAAASEQQMKQSIAEMETGLKAGFDMDIEKDILSWMNGEFAVYTTFNPASDLMKSSKNQTPLDIAMLVQSTDKAKTGSFITKLNVGLTRFADSAPSNVGDNLFLFKGKDGTTVGYGLVNDTFVISTGSGLTPAKTAIAGDGVLSKSDVWKHATADMPRTSQSALFVNLVEITKIAKQMSAGNSSPSTTQGLALLDQFESVIAYGTASADGTSTGTIALLMK